MPQSPPTSHPMTMLEWTMLVALASLWGGSFFFNGVAIRELPVFTVVVSRIALAALVLLLLLMLRGQRMPRDRRVWTAFFGMGLLNNVIPFSLIVWSQQQIASALASILNASTPLFSVLLAHCLTSDEKMTAGKCVGVSIGFIGVAVMIDMDALRFGGSVAAQFACLAGAVSFAVAGLFGRRFRTMGLTPIITAAGQLTTSSLLLLPLMFAIDRPWTLPLPSPATVGALIGVATISTALAFVLYFRILSTAGATNLLLVTFLIPVSAIILGLVFLDEALLPKQLAGMALIGIGLAAIDGRLWQAQHARAAITTAKGVRHRIKTRALGWRRESPHTIQDGPDGG